MRPFLWPTLLREAQKTLFDNTQKHKVWGLGSEEEWAFDADTGELTFVFPNGNVVADAEILGSHNEYDDTWLWSWENKSVAARLTQRAQALRAFGETYDLEPLTDPRADMELDECWHLVAVACHLDPNVCIYRGPSDGLNVFFAFSTVRDERKL
jgi:hypothetical protein